MTEKSGGLQLYKKIPVKRCLKTLLHFDIAVIIFLIVQTILGNTYSLGTILLSLIGWESVGNSNWYIFAVIVLYFLTYISFIFIKDNKYSKYIGTAITVILTVTAIIVLHKYKDVWWYDTLLCYPTGMLYYLFKDKIEKVFTKSKIFYWTALVLSMILTVVFCLLNDILYFLFLKHIFFALTVVLATMKISVNNKILNFFGRYLFPIYILQRIPMIIFQAIGLAQYPVVFVILSFVVTIVIAVPFNMLLNKIDGILFNNRKIISN